MSQYSWVQAVTFRDAAIISPPHHSGADPRGASPRSARSTAPSAGATAPRAGAPRRPPPAPTPTPFYRGRPLAAGRLRIPLPPAAAHAPRTAGAHRAGRRAPTHHPPRRAHAGELRGVPALFLDDHDLRAREHQRLRGPPELLRCVRLRAVECHVYKTCIFTYNFYIGTQHLFRSSKKQPCTYPICSTMLTLLALTLDTHFPQQFCPSFCPDYC